MLEQAYPNDNNRTTCKTGNERPYGTARPPVPLAAALFVLLKDSEIAPRPLEIP
jgi:hypothetical protein